MHLWYRAMKYMICMHIFSVAHWRFKKTGYGRSHLGGLACNSASTEVNGFNAKIHPISQT